ncbi:MAG TPA: hypothetical protein VNF46_05400 [Gammaproteobacteria bacterium]|nr:hypothetical protein [Gammaproteobacteria bacterium]
MLVTAALNTDASLPQGSEAFLFLYALDGRSTPDMDSFIAAVKDKHDGDTVRLSVRTWDGSRQIITLKLDLRYWPTYEVVHTQQGWKREAL